MQTLTQLASAQPRATALFQRALAAGRLHHAYLLTGPHEARPFGVAQAVAAALVCSRRAAGSDGCGECPPCVRLHAGTHPDVVKVVPEGDEAIAIDVIRALSHRLSLSAVESATKVALIDRADQMPPASQNALLKTLEEPPGSTVILLATSRPRLLLPTVRSRCQRVALAPGPRSEARAALEKVGLTPEVSRIVAALVGSDADLALRVAGEHAPEIHAALVKALAPKRAVAEVIDLAGELGSEREEADLAFIFLEVLLRDALAMRHGATGARLYTPPDDSPLKAVPSAHLDAALRRLQQIRRHRTAQINRTLALESVLLELAGVLTKTTA